MTFAEPVEIFTELGMYKNWSFISNLYSAKKHYLVGYYAEREKYLTCVCSKV